MAAITNTFTTNEAVGIREDLANIIYNISPVATPFQSNIGRGQVTNTLFEWQVDELAAADPRTAVPDGGDVTGIDEVARAVRMRNRTRSSCERGLIALAVAIGVTPGRRAPL